MADKRIRSIDQQCTCCGVTTILAFAGLKYDGYELHLCPTCARNLCRMALDHVCIDMLKPTLIRFTRFSGQNK